MHGKINLKANRIWVFSCCCCCISTSTSEKALANGTYKCIQNRKVVWSPQLHTYIISINTRFFVRYIFLRILLICWLDGRCEYLHLGMCLHLHIEKSEENKIKRRRKKTIEFECITATFMDGKFSPYFYFLFIYAMHVLNWSRNDRVLLWNRFASLVLLYLISPVYWLFEIKIPTYRISIFMN